MTSRARAPHLRLVSSRQSTPQPPRALMYRNRHGVPYYLHQGQTKTGKVRYFVARTVGEGALDAMPAGFEITESINGVVSVRRVDATRPGVPAADLEVVRAEVARHGHLRRHVVDERGGEIVIHEPVNSFDFEGMSGLAADLGVSVERMRAAASRRPARYTPVMKFAPEPLGDGVYSVFRMTYRGQGGWHLLSGGRLAVLAKRYVGHIGKESFFELM